MMRLKNRLFAGESTKAGSALLIAIYYNFIIF